MEYIEYDDKGILLPYCTAKREYQYVFKEEDDLKFLGRTKESIKENIDQIDAHIQQLIKHKKELENLLIIGEKLIKKATLEIFNNTKCDQCNNNAVYIEVDHETELDSIWACLCSKHAPHSPEGIPLFIEPTLVKID